MDIPVYIVASTRRKAVVFAEKLGLEPGDWIYLDELHRVRGARWFRYILAPGAELSEETKEILRRFGAEYVGQKQLQAEKLFDRTRRGNDE